MSTPAPTHRSGPVRSDDARRAILQATADEFLAKGYERLTIQGVAATARVGKQTIYRWWGGKPELLTDCLVEGLLWDPELVVADSGDVVRDVADWLRRVLDPERPQARQVLRSLLGAASTDETLATHLDTLLRGEHERGVVHRLCLAVGRGEIRPDVDVVTVSDLLLGLLIVRTLTQRPTSSTELETSVRQLIAPL